MDNWTISKVLDNFNLNSGFVIFDLGTHLGQELDAFLPSGAEVHSFEPHPKLAKYVKEKFKGNNNLFFNECAVWLKNEVKDFYFKKDASSSWMSDDGSSLLKEKQNISGKYFTQVKCIDVSEYIFNLDKQIDIMKLDIEGVEYHIIKHLIETGAINMIDNLFFEDHSRRFSQDCFEYYQNKKFVFERIDNLKTNFGTWQ